MPEKNTRIDIDKGDGATPAMNRGGPRADDDRTSSPAGNRGWDEPADEAPGTIEGAVRSSEGPAPTADADAPGSAAAHDEPALAAAPEPNEPA